MSHFNGAASTWGLTHEINNPYGCAGGNALDHFDQTDAACDKFPFNGTCSGEADPKWYWGGAAGVSGEANMLTYLAQGISMYATFNTYSNFMSLRDYSIYTATEGPVKGGHAVVLIGYGIDSGTKYWIMQNSWGTWWGSEGYARFLRGTNLAEIEDGAHIVRAWAEGASEIPCFDSTDGTGLSSQGVAIGCDQAINGPFGNLCTNPKSKDIVVKKCMKTCGACEGFNGAPQTTTVTTTLTTTVAVTSTTAPSAEMEYAKCLTEIIEKL